MLARSLSSSGPGSADRGARSLNGSPIFPSLKLEAVQRVIPPFSTERLSAGMHRFFSYRRY
jgi:hypothetical protein